MFGLDFIWIWVKKSFNKKLSLIVCNLKKMKRKTLFLRFFNCVNEGRGSLFFIAKSKFCEFFGMRLNFFPA